MFKLAAAFPRPAAWRERLTPPSNDGASVKKINVWVTSLERGEDGC